MLCAFPLNLVFDDVVFFFEQKTAYEMRISDWSSDVCSSDLEHRHLDDPCRGAAQETGDGLGFAVHGSVRRHARSTLLDENRPLGRKMRMSTTRAGVITFCQPPDMKKVA